MTKLTLIVPNQSVRQAAAEVALRPVLSLEAGGFSVYDGEGEWRDPEHLAIVESHRRYEILCDSARTRLRVLEAFRAFGRAAGEHTLLWWTEEVNARFEEVQYEQAV